MCLQFNLARSGSMPAICNIALGFLFSIFAWHCWGHSYSLDYDEGVYLSTARVCGIGERLYSDVFYAQPPFYIVSLRIIFAAFGDSVQTGRLLSLSACLGIFILTVFVCTRYFCRWSGTAAGALVLYLMFTAWNPTTCQPEALSLFLFMAALVAALELRHPISGVVSGFLFALAIMTKLLVAPLGAVLLLVLVLPHPRMMRAKRVLALSLFSAVILATVVFFMMGTSLSEFWDQVYIYHRKASGVFTTSVGENANILAGIACKSVPCVFACVALLYYIKVNKNYIKWILLVWLAAGTSFLLTHAPLFPRHAVILFPLLSMGLAGVIHMLIGRDIGGTLKKEICCVAAAALLASASVDCFFRVAERTLGGSDNGECLAYVRDTFGSRFTISDDPILVYYAGGLLPPGLCDTSFVRIRASYLSASDVISASLRFHAPIIFKTGRFRSIAGLFDHVEGAGWAHLNFGGTDIYIPPGER